MRISALLPILAAINILLVAYGVIPRHPKNPERKEFALKKFGTIGKVLGYFMLALGVFIILLQLKIIVL